MFTRRDARGEREAGNGIKAPDRGGQSGALSTVGIGRGLAPSAARGVSRFLSPSLLVLAGLAGLLSCADNETPPPAKQAYQSGAPPALACVPNLDGKIDANELTPALGVAVTYLVAPQGKERVVDLLGAPNAQGQQEWRLGFDYADDQVARIAATKLEGKWYAPSFASVPNAFTSPLDLGGRTDGIYTYDEAEIRLHGIASVVENPPEGKTLYAYDKPVTIYRFPIQPGATWTSSATVRNGTLRGLPYAGKDTYEQKVDGAGAVVLPDLTFTQAMRVRTLVTIVPSAGAQTTQRQTGFVFECFGEVARATSRLNEPEENFTTASELRRLGLEP
jgi:hypothetical protein